MSNTESTVCLFNPNNSECRSPKRTNLSMLMCRKHLKDYFGLEVGYHLDDHATNVAWVGPFLRPIKNVTYFKRNTVIFPTKEFFDQTMRPEEYGRMNNTFRKYQMNPAIIDQIRLYSLNAGKSVENRFVIEMYRNLMSKKVDPGHKHETLFPQLQSQIQSKKSISKTLISNQSIYPCLEDAFMYINGKIEPVKSDNLHVCMQYLLFNCLYSEFKVTFDSELFSDYLLYNCEFVENVGLVATELINHPHPLIINGVLSGSQIFYNSFVSMVQKEVLQKNYTLKDIPSQYAFTNALKSGSIC